MKKLIADAYEALKNGEDICLVSVIASSGSTPRGAGAKMLVGKEGYIAGAIGGGAVEFKSIQLAMETILKTKSFLQKFTLAKNEVEDIGMICGGNVELFFQYISAEDKNTALFKSVLNAFGGDNNSWLVTEILEHCQWNTFIYRKNCIDSDKKGVLPYLKKKSVLIEQEKSKCLIEPLASTEKVYIFGGGHISQRLVPLLTSINFNCVVVEDRADFANPKLFPEAEKTLVVDFAYLEKDLKIGPWDYVTILTRGHKNDYEILVHALKTEACYIGLVGSRTKLGITKERLLKDGFTEHDLKRVYAPIGLAIKAETPEEIAVSIAGEFIRVRAELHN